MTRLFSPARTIFGISIAFFGLEYLLQGHFVSGLPPAPPWTPGGPPLAYLLGLVLLIAGASLAAAFKPSINALVIAAIFLACALLLHGAHLHGILADGNLRTGAFEALGISGAAFVVAYRLFLAHPLRRQSASFASASGLLGRVLFAIAMLVFGEQHFQYVSFVAPLIPAWIPFHVAMVYLTGAGFVAAGLAIAFNLLRPLAALLLGIMFLSWVLLLHIPRVVREPHNSGEWISAVVALCFAAGSFAIASAPEASNPQR